MTETQEFRRQHAIPTAVELAARVDRLASIPAVVQRVMAEISRSNAQLATVAREIESDPPLSAQLLRVANSGFYARGAKVTSVQVAATRIGLKELRNIVATAMLAKAFPGEENGLELGELYRQALLCAASAEHIARATTIINRRDAGNYYTAALLHDLGLFVLYRLLPELLQDCVRLAETSTFAEVESKLLGYSHGEVGALTATRWRFSEEEIACCRWHHLPDQAPAPHQAAVALVHVADHVACEVIQDQRMRLFVPECRPAALSALGLTADKLPALIETARGLVEKVDNLCRMIKAA